MSVINTNVKALAAQASMSNVNKSMETAMERLSTGIRINSAKDDAAGLSANVYVGNFNAIICATNDASF